MGIVMQLKPTWSKWRWIVFWTIRISWYLYGTSTNINYIMTRQKQQLECIFFLGMVFCWMMPPKYVVQHSVCALTFLVYTFYFERWKLCMFRGEFASCSPTLLLQTFSCSTCVFVFMTTKCLIFCALSM